MNDRVEAFESAVYKEANSVFANAGGEFQDVSAEAGLTLVKAHRGAAFADFDGDGRMDAVVSSLGEPAELWRKREPRAAATGCVLRLRGTKSNRDGIGARIRSRKAMGRDDECRRATPRQAWFRCILAWEQHANWTKWKFAGRADGYKN